MLQPAQMLNQGAYNIMNLSTRHFAAFILLGGTIALSGGCATGQKNLEPIAKKQAESEFLKGLDVIEKPELEPDWADYVKERYPNWKRHYWYDRGQWRNRGYIVGGPPETGDTTITSTPAPLPPVAIENTTPVIEDTTPPVIKEPPKPTEYTVVKGDSLWKIAGKLYGNPFKWPNIYRANKDKIKNPHKIYPNQVLVIPWD
jgi:nucleoid-associated protein YgaU